MLTEEQIDNWRGVLQTIIGPWAFMMSDQEIQLYHDALQHKIDSRAYSFHIKVKLKEDLDREWRDIEFEPKVITCTFGRMKEQCSLLMKRRPEIEAILIVDCFDPTDVYEVLKGE